MGQIVGSEKEVIDWINDCDVKVLVAVLEVVKNAHDGTVVIVRVQRLEADILQRDGGVSFRILDRQVLNG